MAAVIELVVVLASDQAKKARGKLIHDAIRPGSVGGNKRIDLPIRIYRRMLSTRDRRKEWGFSFSQRENTIA